MAASSLGIRSKQYCSTAAIALSLGPMADPSIKARVEIVVTWLQYWHAHPQQRARLRKAWHRLLPKLTASTRWLRVKGPMGALQATLRDIRWNPFDPAAWKDPSGEIWSYTGSLAGLSSLTRAIAESVRAQLWSAASANHPVATQGMASGVDLTVPTRLCRKFLASGRAAEHAILLQVASGGSWVAERLAGAGLGSEICP
eukprot:8380595-Alexandrium_andersonii.AAC.1